MQLLFDNLEHLSFIFQYILYIPNKQAPRLKLCSYLHKVLLHVVGHEFNDFLLAVKLLR